MSEGLSKQKTILLVSANTANVDLMEKAFHQESFCVLKAHHIEALDQILGRSEAISVAMLDLVGLDQSIWERCEILRSREIPFFVITPSQSQKLDQACRQYGASGVLVKPLVVKKLLDFVNSLVVDADGDDFACD